MDPNRASVKFVRTRLTNTNETERSRASAREHFEAVDVQRDPLGITSNHPEVSSGDGLAVAQDFNGLGRHTYWPVSNVHARYVQLNEQVFGFAHYKEGASRFDSEIEGGRLCV